MNRCGSTARTSAIIIAIGLASVVVGVTAWDRLVIRRKLTDGGAAYLIVYANGVQQLSNGELEAAKGSFMQAVKLDPSRYEAYLGLGQVFEFRGQTNLALQSYRSAVVRCQTRVWLEPQALLPTLRQQRREPLGHRLIKVQSLAVLENSNLPERGSQIIVVKNPHLRKVANGSLEVRQRAGKSRTEVQACGGNYKFTWMTWVSRRGFWR